MTKKFNEPELEQAILELFGQVGTPHVHGENIHKEVSDVLLRDDLRLFLKSKYASEGITEGEIKSIENRLDHLPSSDLYGSNKKIMDLVSNGFTLNREDRNKKDIFIQLLDYETPENNLFKIVNQFEIQGFERRIPDGILYINGLPLVVLEFKSAIKEKIDIRQAYDQLTIRYRRDIPELFKYNAFCVISDGVNNKMGSFFAHYKFFYAWRKVEIEDEPADGINSLHTMMKGLFDKKRMVDVIHHFIYFPDTSKEDIKIVCRYPQYYAGNKLLGNIIKNKKHPDTGGDGKGGTYFGATGSGKSFTMLFLARLLMKSEELSAPTIILITDRNDLDSQLSEQFTNAKRYIGDENVVSVESREDLRDKLQGVKSGGVYLTTIQKFTEDTELLTERNNVVCISDEAHRSQINLDKKTEITTSGVKKGVLEKYGFAHYLHKSLPNATYVGVTGTPVDKTLEVFGEVLDAYTMKESVKDEITVRIVYEGRAAKVLLNEQKLQEIEEYYEKCAEDGANEYQIEESKKSVAKMEVILGDPDRLKLLAKDFVEHYENKITEGASVKGKVMFVSSSRPIAYSFYKEVIALRPEWAEIKECDEEAELTESEKRKIKPMEKIKMVMTRNKDDEKELYDTLGSKDYRKELDRQFKNEKSNFKIAIVVDMWLTGFDVPCLETIYIDKPVKQHSLIQTISRVNRVYEGKEIGLVVDYIGIKSNMNLALKKYGKGGKIAEDDFYEAEKAVPILKDQLDLLSKIFHNFDNSDYFNGSPLEKLNCLNRSAEYVMQTEDLEHRFMAIVKKLRSAFKLCSHHEEVTIQDKDFIYYYFAVRSIVFKLTKGEAPDTAQMNDTVRKMVEEALISEGVEDVFSIDEDSPDIDIFSDEYLAKIDKIKLPNTKIKLLQQLLKKTIEEFKKVNRIKGVDFSKKLKKLIDSYNERKDFDVFKSDVLDDLADKFADLFKDLQKEKNSFEDMGIDFEEKAFYDILKAVAEKYEFEYPHEKLIALSRSIKEIVDDKAKYTDWTNKDDVKAELKFDLVETLEAHRYPPDPQDEVFKEIFEQAENFKKYL